MVQLIIFFIGFNFQNHNQFYIIDITLNVEPSYQKNIDEQHRNELKHYLEMKLEMNLFASLTGHRAKMG